MKKLIPSFSLFLLLFTLSTTPSLALTLDSIGSSSITTQTFSEWWYTSQNPLFSGTAAASSTVTVTIDGTANTATADAAGNWTYAPTTLTDGDHTVAITGDGQTMNFTIHVGQNVPSSITSTASSSGSTLPVSGSLTQTLLLLGFGGGAIIAGFSLKPKTA